MRFGLLMEKGFKSQTFMLFLFFLFPTSEGYRAPVLGAKESGWIYELAWSSRKDETLILSARSVWSLVLHFFRINGLPKTPLSSTSGSPYGSDCARSSQSGLGLLEFSFICYYFLIRHDMAGYMPFWAYNAAFLFTISFFLRPRLPPLLYMTGQSRFRTAKNLVFTLMSASPGAGRHMDVPGRRKAMCAIRLDIKHERLELEEIRASGKHTLADTSLRRLGVSEYRTTSWR